MAVEGQFLTVIKDFPFTYPLVIWTWGHPGLRSWNECGPTDCLGDMRTLVSICSFALNLPKINVLECRLSSGGPVIGNLSAS